MARATWKCPFQAAALALPFKGREPKMQKVPLSCAMPRAMRGRLCGPSGGPSSSASLCAGRCALRARPFLSCLEGVPDLGAQEAVPLGREHLTAEGRAPEHRAVVLQEAVHLAEGRRMRVQPDSHVARRVVVALVLADAVGEGPLAPVVDAADDARPGDHGARRALEHVEHLGAVRPRVEGEHELVEHHRARV
eukprot:CAMPEP_0206020232 /NCGR_PEP_ID=MMETSP1464-20131121/30651_1 /ASSEMBLY_ACC=CAM_ASM_001124 /TAXON_ID=119497 /ORGANISM="Exanthemachrysis gayraliae, Strain RCC1523" /LENGTH=192 /DNA_ID=CAMNT_0053394161 /DNA_START=397 /DNA_END=972 /DNA_ORIENTATION=-